MYQSCNGLMYMHSAELIHRDLKPANILMTSECLVKIADLGLARSLQANNKNTLTDYVATRWYRAPEILLGSVAYGKPVDMWSMGIIFGEMLGGKAVFPGSSTLNQLERICAVVGMPNDEEIQSMQSPFAKTMIDNLKVEGKGKGWQHMYPKASKVELDLLRELMHFDPGKRLTAQGSLSHEYCKVFHSQKASDDELPAKAPVSIDIDDNEKKTTAVYRDKLYVAIDGTTGPPDKAKNRKSDKGKKKDAKEEGEEKKE